MDKEQNKIGETFQTNAMITLPKLLEEFYLHDPVKEDPEALHQLRICAKRLRYSLELYEPCYGNRLDSYIDNIKSLQEVLGAIHDCDVMLEFLQAQSSKISQKYDSTKIECGFDYTIADFKRKRKKYVEEFFHLWHSKYESNFKEELLKVILNPSH
ncbi:MAG: CHAD domain-containing protein [Blastocatellia bacterium]|nr:CHAD domain-containing protein [Blastocatellia bacterium]